MLVEDPVLLHQWHPVLMSKDLTEEPKGVEVLGEKVVVFRTSKGVHAFKDLCIHRGVPLSLGKVENDEIVCAYHGWTYNGCGACTKIPSMPKGRVIPSKAKTTTYSCAEKFGFVWICLGFPPETEPTIGTNTFDNPDYVRVVMGPYDVQAAGPRVVENFLDVSHLMYVHEGLLGDSAYSEISDYRVHEINGQLVTDEIEVYQPDPDGRGYGVHSLYKYKVHKPLTVSFTKKIVGSENFFELYLIVLPVTEASSVAFMIMERNYALDDPDEIFIAFQDVLIEQDRVIVENQKPELLPLDLQAELHLKCDRLSIAYRRMLGEIEITFGTA
ncbi:aromatic ring-hydroxylating dioxygenase subunit alpha [Robertmurraya kyonggiensis]|uniref:Aromatic ring-hydroxylating dioxygenase subunit alpha n=1 Tax=Robertmurraya kyonggiensis TaxID=1037680 RepID=A0A4U1DA20_9BACI|nr:aromatic ring-hydroxylating dioxygenase subunit alpha [Robertmurraya kyonggiensis]TKC18968.1 aromatic ring-hydroxylating dioxygenase subunit alpha [Robertmurraya kyonggiensis]